jgi:NTP pyrophosphatase (non-canonical NTP hydrolase)
MLGDVDDVYEQDRQEKLDEEMNILNEQINKASKEAINGLCLIVHKANTKWWIDLETGLPLKRNIGELLMLTVSELAEALEGHRKNLQDDKLPHRKMFEVELADTIIRIFDIAGGLGLDLGGAFSEKMQFNAVREDHKPEHRKSEHGKKY